jgi:Zn-dependent oligopeptidase
VVDASEWADPWTDETLDLPTLTPAQIAIVTSEAIGRANNRIDAAVAEGDAPQTFESLFGGLDDAAREVATAFGRGAAQALTASDDAVRDAQFAANETIEKWRGAVPLREDLARAIERFLAASDVDALAAEDRAYVRRWQTDVRLAGAGLPAGARAEVARLADRVIELGSIFQNNLVAARHIEVATSDLEGLPADFVASLEPGAAAGILDVPVDYANYFQLMERARNRDVRERAHRASYARGFPENIPVLEEVLAARRRIAELQGYPSWQALRIANLAAPDAATINEFIRDMGNRLMPVVEGEVAAMAEVLRAEPGAPADLVVQEWDWRYAEQLQRAALGSDSRALADYLELDRVLDGLAELSEEIFGVRLVAHPERTGWNPDVRPFDLVDVASERVVAHLFMDPYVRHGKQPGAWMESLIPGGGRSGERRPPTLSLVLNSPVPKESPSLLAGEDVETLFHEYGHVLNYALGCSRFVVHRQSWIAFDFVEGPSEFVGRWGLQPPVMSRFARHRSTGETVPGELIAGLARAEALNAGYKLQRTLAVGWLDALLHGEDPPSIDAATRRAWAIRGTPYIEGTAPVAGINHIVAGGYDAAYYGYAWSEVIRDDLLERFVAGGITSPEMGAAYRSTILEVPWTADPVEAVNMFLGRRWSADAFLNRVS